MLKTHATLIQTAKGCIWIERGKHYKSLNGAKSAVKRDAKKLAREWGKVLTVLEIELL